MKKTLLIIGLLASVACRAQIVNNSFENWALDTFYLASGEIAGLPADTTIFPDPIGWTSSNAISNLDSLGRQILVTPDSDAYSGNLAIKMLTATIHLPVFSTLQSIVLPGFVVSGTVVINPQALLLSAAASGSITPGSLPGAGQHINQRLANIAGYYNYKPVFNTYTNSNDTCMIYATLRKDTEIVANAIFKSADSTGGYLPFSANFQYISCDMPDTLVILMASSKPEIPSITDILSGITNLVPGSSLLVDSMYYDTLPAGYSFPPFVANDYDTTLKNTPDTINVTINDTDCSGGPLTVTIIKSPADGTASLDGDSIIYTPNTGYTGADSILYQVTNNNGDTADAWVKITVLSTSGIFGISKNVSMSVFPVPVSNELNVVFDNSGATIARVYDMLGNVVLTTSFHNNSNRISTSSMANGLYLIELSDETNGIIGTAKFVVSR
jgi:enamine deaminase RidA (YjgF/YER057c/UK114 family)